MKAVLMASRPKTLVAAFVPPAMAYALSVGLEDKGSALVMLLCVLAAIFIQLATNFFNDAFDFEKGADTEKRIGETRAAQSGALSTLFLKRLGFLSLLFAAIFSIKLISIGGPIILILGLLSLFLSYGYTGGPYPLAYKGLGEVFVFLFFGLFSVVGSYYLMTLKLPVLSFVMAIQVGLLCCSLIMINNLRDAKQDILVGKMTLAKKMFSPVPFYHLF